MHIKKIEKQLFLVTQGQAEIILIKFVNALSKKGVTFYPKPFTLLGSLFTILYIIIIRKMLFFHTFIRDSCSVG